MIRYLRIGICIQLATVCFYASSFAQPQSPDFETEIAPLLIKRCLECHQGKHPSGGLNLESLSGLLTGGDSGEVTQGYLLERVESGEMPPAKQGRSQQLPDHEIQLIRRWIDSGMNWPEQRTLDYFERTNEVRAGRDWWSLQPVTRPVVPKLVDATQPENPIDAFIRSKLEAQQMQPAPIAGRETLIRRLYHTLIGLPPSEQEIQQFLKDESPEAWESLIDQLLEMPQYGERWGRYWLDLARYADTSGYERDQEKPYAWKYRDWVVSALNDDMPYDQFILHQLAGDEIPDRTKDSVIATGFLRLGTWNDEPNDPADYQYERLEDLVHTTSSTFLALTVKCARCHAHKFDPITQEDYYRMASAFWAGPVQAGRSREHLGGPTSAELGFEDVLGWTDLGSDPDPLHLLKNGERHQPLDVVVPASLSTIPALDHVFDAPPARSKTTQRRLQLAQWMIDPRHPLTDRVMMNRLWLHHFGQAIVRTPNNFGYLSDSPTHPELLDWLAVEFQERGRHLKEMHRLILTSQTWQQSTLHPEYAQYQHIDPANRLWWHAGRRRLDAESLRDHLLTVSGELDLDVGGPGFKPSINPGALEGLSKKDNDWEASPPKDQKRRSIYLYLKRGLLPPIMTTFDLCDPTLSCGQRDVTVVPTQALALLNNQFVHDRSQSLAVKISEQNRKVDEQVKQAWSSILSRQPTAHEMQRALQHLQIQQQEFTAHRSKQQQNQDQLMQQMKKALVLHLRAQAAMTYDETARVRLLPDLSGHAHHAIQDNVLSQPRLMEGAVNGQPELIFDGDGQYLVIDGQVLESQHCTIICVVNDQGGSGHREVISNWDGSAGNSTTSVFLGITGQNDIRFSDALIVSDALDHVQQMFVLTASNGMEQSAVFQNGRLLKQAQPLPQRRLETKWVIGQQGNINGEFWKGGIAEVRVYNRELSLRERQYVEQSISKRYAIPLNYQDQQPLSAETLALASLCHVLMNSNEFLYVD